VSVWKIEVVENAEGSGETMLLVGSEADGFLNVSWKPPIEGHTALAILNNLTQALDIKLTGSCANERILKAYKFVADAHSKQELAHG